MTRRVICPAAWIRYLKRFLRRDRTQTSFSLPIFVLSFELGKSVWRHVHAAKVLVMHNILEGLQITAWRRCLPSGAADWRAQIRVIVHPPGGSSATPSRS
jgi:hypothetical protein